MKKQNELYAKIGIVAIAILAIILLIPGILPSIGALFTSEISLCDDTPYDASCICNIGQAKVGMFPWKCENLPELPSEVIFPIETWQEARAYSEGLLGSGFLCTGDYQYNNLLSGDISKECDKYGNVITTFPNIYLGNVVELECVSIDTVDSEGRPVIGTGVFSTRFDPNDGHIYQLICNSDLIDCPETTFTNNNKVNPPTTCGDGCCHFGETNENCPSDCDPIPVPICEASDVSNWISENGGQSAYESLCSNVGGTTRIIGVSLYDECNYKQIQCNVEGIEVLRWWINSIGVCGTHELMAYDQDTICPEIM